MNKERRKLLDEVQDRLLEAQEFLEHVISGEEEAFYNLPESLQGSERGQRMEEIIDSLNEVNGNLDDAIEAIGEAME